MAVIILAKSQDRKRKPAPNPALGRRIKALREGADLSQREAAIRAGYSEGYLGSIESGKGRPSIEALQAFASVLGADFDELARLAGFLPPRQSDDFIEQVDRELDAWEEEAQKLSAWGRSIVARLRQRDRLRDPTARQRPNAQPTEPRQGRNGSEEQPERV